LNLYGMLNNNLVNKIDVSGLYDFKPIEDMIHNKGIDAIKASDANLLKRQQRYDDLPSVQKVGKDRPTHAWEFCGSICRKCENGNWKYYATGPVIGLPTACDWKYKAPCKGEDKVVGAYHNHPNGSTLSPKDKNAADLNRVLMGASFKSGTKYLTDIYNPHTGATKRKESNQ